MARKSNRSVAGWFAGFVIFGLMAGACYGVWRLTAPEDLTAETSLIHELAFYGELITGVLAVLCFLVAWLVPLSFTRRR